jgi:hypothetical protein
MPLLPVNGSAPNAAALSMGQPVIGIISDWSMHRKEKRNMDHNDEGTLTRITSTFKGDETK